MSYLTHIWIDDIGEEEIDIFAVEDALVAFGDAQNLSAVVSLVIDAFQAMYDAAGPYAMHNCYDGVVRGVCAEIARLLPATQFVVRGVGEEADDVWLATYRGGGEQKCYSLRGCLNVD